MTVPGTTSTSSAVPRVPRGAVLALAGAGLLAIGLAVGLLLVQGRLVAGPFDPGLIVRYGLPAARAAHDLAAAVSVGLLVLAAWCVAPEPGAAPGQLGGARQFAVRLAGIAVIGWLVLGIVVLIFTASDVSGFQPSAPGFSGVLLSFVTQIDLGRALGFSLLLVIVVGNLTLSATRITTVAWAAVLAIAALLPLALAGHAAGTADHMNSVDSLALHLVGVCVWVGGLAGLLLISRRLRVPAAGRRRSLLDPGRLVLRAGGDLRPGQRRAPARQLVGPGQRVRVAGDRQGRRVGHAGHGRLPAPPVHHPPAVPPRHEASRGWRSSRC